MDHATAGLQPERFHSDEMNDLMARVQELMEATVLAMIIRHPVTGRVSITCPPQHHAEVVKLLREGDWASLP